MEKVAKWLILQREQATMLEKLCIMQSETNTVSEASSMIVLCRSTKCCTSAPVAHWVEPVTHMLRDKQLPGFDYAPGNFLCAISPLSLSTYFAAPSSKCYKMPIKKPCVWSVSASVSKTRKTPWYAKSWGNTKTIQKCQMCKVTLCKYLCFVIKTQENLIDYN